MRQRLAGEVAQGPLRHGDQQLAKCAASSRGEITKVLKTVEKPLAIDAAKKPFVVLVAGVNGTGKTTTIGKIAKRLTDQGHKVVLAAGDTFRAAAIEQLTVWGERTGAEVVARAPARDAAGLAFEASNRRATTERRCRADRHGRAACRTKPG